MSEWFTVGIAKDGAKNIGRAGHDIAEIGGGILDEFRAARELFTGNPHEAAKKSWGRSWQKHLGRGRHCSSHRACCGRVRNCQCNSIA